MARISSKVRCGMIRNGRIIGALVLALLLSASGPWGRPQAQGTGCTEQCKAAFGACYKSTANRAVCEQQMQRCLERCIQSKHG